MAEKIDLRQVEGRVSFYLLRHGESEGNREGIMQGRNPSRLTERGLAQAREAGSWFRARAIDCILSSPLERARATAQAVAEAAGVRAVETAEALTEIDIGLFTGLSLGEARERHPAQHARFLQESWEGVDGAERIADLYPRALSAWNLLLARAAAGGRSILAVTHSGFLQWLLRATLGLESWMPLFNASDNCCVSHLLVDNQPMGSLGPGGPSPSRSYYASWMLVNSPVVAPSR
jgi:broad specificity phosphatase PhoE